MPEAEIVQLDDYTPADVVAPVRVGGRGVIGDITKLGRQTATVEQRTDAERHIVAELMKIPGATAGEATIHWSRGEATRLRVTLHVEHVTLEHDDGTEYVERIGVVDTVTETSLAGDTINPTRAERALQLQAEVAEMAARGDFE